VITGRNALLNPRLLSLFLISLLSGPRTQDRGILRSGYIEAAASVRSQQEEGLRFELLRTWRGAEKAGRRVAGARYRADDGVEVEKTVETYRSVDETRARMQRMMQKAARILERAPKTRGGHRVGERAVVEFRGSQGRETKAAILWTDGAALFILKSSSLRHVLALEKQAYEAPRPSRLPQAKRLPLPLPQ
jgi:hypothetical protein